MCAGIRLRSYYCGGGAQLVVKASRMFKVARLKFLALGLGDTSEQPYAKRGPGGVICLGARHEKHCRHHKHAVYTMHVESDRNTKYRHAAYVSQIGRLLCRETALPRGRPVSR